MRNHRNLRRKPAAQRAVITSVSLPLELKIRSEDRARQRQARSYSDYIVKLLLIYLEPQSQAA